MLAFTILLQIAAAVSPYSRNIFSNSFLQCPARQGSRISKFNMRKSTYKGINQTCLLVEDTFISY